MANDPNPYGNYYFVLELDNTEVGHFMECSGLKSAAQVFEIGTPASMRARQPPVTEAMEDEPLDSVMSETRRTV